MGALVPGQEFRDATNMRTLELVSLDIDNGQPAQEIIARARASGTHIDIHPSWSSGKPSTGILIDAIRKHHKLPQGTVPTLDHCRRLPARHQEVARRSAGHHLRCRASRLRDGGRRTHPMSAFASSFLSRTPCASRTLGVGLKLCSGELGAHLLGFAAFLGVEHCDPACKDLSRLFYPNRRPQARRTDMCACGACAIDPDGWWSTS